MSMKRVFVGALFFAIAGSGAQASGLTGYSMMELVAMRTICDQNREPVTTGNGSHRMSLPGSFKTGYENCQMVQAEIDSRNVVAMTRQPVVPDTRAADQQWLANMLPPKP
jgi:hypothetical protein